VDGVALAATIGGAAVGIAGIFFGWLSARGERQSAIALAASQHAHERQLARTTRLYDDSRTAYEGLADLILLMGEVVERTHPIIGPLPDPPARPPDKELRMITARASVIGSQEVMDAADRLARQWQTFLLWADAVTDATQGAASIPEARTQMEDARSVFRARSADFFRMIRSELRD
jgi:hypothetical protein